jgi:hypothetical protein
MRRNKKRIVAAVAVIGALAAGGAAFTDGSITTGATGANTGYGSIAVDSHGEHLSSVVYGFNSDGSQITGVHLTFTGTGLNNQYVSVAFNSSTSNVNNSGTDLTPLSASTCTDATTHAALITGTDVTCTINPGADTQAAQNLDVLVKDSPTN